MKHHSLFNSVMLFGLSLGISIVTSISKAETVNGFIVRGSLGWSLVSADDQNQWSVIPNDDNVLDSLNKLKSRDYIVGQGSVSSGTIRLETIDFVGLRNLLGLWISDSTWFNFKTFTQANIYWGVDDSSAVTPIRMQYSVAPGATKAWQIFFSDDKLVQIASLKIENDEAMLEFYNPDTGDVVKTLNLRKLTSNQALK